MKKILSNIIALVLIVSTFAFSPTAYAACPNTHSTTIVAASNAYLDASDSTSLAPATLMTVEFWAKFTTFRTPAGTANFVIGKDVVGSREYALGVETGNTTATGTMYAQFAGNETSPREGTTVLTTGTWYHLAYVWETTGNTVKFYINGVLELSATFPVDPPDTATALTFGRRLYDGLGAANNSPFNGLLDDVRLWNTNRTPTELLAYKSYEVDTSTGLQGSWHLNNSTTDSSGNSNTLTNHSNTYTTDFAFTCTFPETTVYPFLRIENDVILEGDVIINP